MKKVIFLAVLLLSINFAKAELHFGVMAGYNSSLTLSSISDVTNGTYNLSSVQNELWNNFHAGIFARIGKKIYFQPELLYAVKNNHYQLTIQDALSNDVTLNKFVNIGTVDVPLLVGYTLLNLKVINARVFAGPRLSFLANSALSFENITGGTFDTSQLTNDVKKANIGFELGAGVDVLMFTLDAHYNLISNMYETKFQDVNITNLPSSSLVISLGWKIF